MALLVRLQTYLSVEKLRRSQKATEVGALQKLYHIIEIRNLEKRLRDIPVQFKQDDNDCKSHKLWA